MEVNFPKLEGEVLERWRKEKTFEKSVERRKGSPRFVFYEGPPTANAGPGLHHVLSRVFKDIVLRYKTMRGFLAERRAGWDTHGLPVELQIEKKLGLKSKKDIEKYGIAKFNEECRKSVWEYKKEWEDLTERIGFWLDMRNPYITYETSYSETLWFIIKQFWKKKLLYKDYKVVPYCPRCGTPLSSHEMAQGYQITKDLSVFVKFPISTFQPRRRTAGSLRGRFSQALKIQKRSSSVFGKVAKFQTYLLAWTTTPWTLPGNVALALKPDISYVLAEKEGAHYVLAKDLAENVLGRHKVLHTMKGKDLVGLAYEPLFRFGKPQQGKKIWQVVPADFVSTKEGTGIVHTAVAYGEDDFELGKKENLAMLHLVDEQGRFAEKVKPWKGMFVKNADPFIVEALKKKGLLWREEWYEHEYPFCWRCSSPLLYYAKESWFVNIRKVKKQLIGNNREINWIPSHIREGRIGEWLKEAKDWAFSRERYWGTPLPVWQCSACGNEELIGSLKELAEQKFSSNTYYVLRHGHSARQVVNVMSCWPERTPFPLTEQGKRQIKEVAKEFARERVDLIFSSDLLRAKQTAQILGEALGIKPQFDKRLREWDVGVLNGKPLEELGRVWGKPHEIYEEHHLRRFVEPMPKGESYVDVQKRLYGFVREIDKKYQQKRILLVSHEMPLTLLETTLRGFSRKEIVDFRAKKKFLNIGEWRTVPFAQLPLNGDMEVDLHRPFVDEIRFFCAKCKKGTMERVKEVVDVWFDSGAMPFAQAHWPFQELQSRKFQASGFRLQAPQLFPADYIVEGIDQTRGWFYTLLAVSTLLGFKAPYKNVISLGHLLDEKGEKMSKSKGNVVNPWDMVARYGADAVRWYFFTLNNPGDPKLFSERDIQHSIGSFLLTFWNCVLFFKIYAVRSSALQAPRSKLRNVLDRWILSRLTAVIQGATEKLDLYDVTAAARILQDFAVNDLSLWYIRRSRSRFQNPASHKDLKEAGAVLGFVLGELSKLSSPFIPFLTERIFGELGNKGSVHWEDWPKARKEFRSDESEHQMRFIREVAAKALGERAKAGIKVRQPLASLTLKAQRQKIKAEFLELLKDEVNVKEVLFDPNINTAARLDTRITAELREEGMVRELIRSIQNMRKEAGYRPGEKIRLEYAGAPELRALVSRHAEFLQRIVGAKKLEERTGKGAALLGAQTLSVGGGALHIWLKKG